jgi:hypothetical protein
MKNPFVVIFTLPLHRTGIIFIFKMFRSAGAPITLVFHSKRIAIYTDCDRMQYGFFKKNQNKSVDKKMYRKNNDLQIRKICD